MNWSLIFSIVIAILLFRVLMLRIKANSLKAESFKNLPPKDKLAVLKECLLNTPAESYLQNLAEFCQKNGINANIEEYRPFIAKQRALAKKKEALAEDNELFEQEARWMDSIYPLEFEEAKQAWQDEDESLAIKRSVEGIARLYSDKAIRDALLELSSKYPKANAILEGYEKLVAARDESLADDESLKKLRKLRDNWEEELLNIEL